MADKNIPVVLGQLGDLLNELDAKAGTLRPTKQLAFGWAAAGAQTWRPDSDYVLIAMAAIGGTVILSFDGTLVATMTGKTQVFPNVICILGNNAVLTNMRFGLFAGTPYQISNNVAGQALLVLESA